MGVEEVVLEAALRCRGDIAPHLHGHFQGKNRCSISYSGGKGSGLEGLTLTHPEYSLRVASYGKCHAVPLDSRLESVTCYAAGACEVLRLEFADSGYFEIEFQEFGGSREGRSNRARWENVIKKSQINAICNKFYEPVGSTPESIRLQEDLLENALVRLTSVLEIDVDTDTDGAKHGKRLVVQGEFLLKCRRQMSELLMRLQNGGIDFISSSEVERLQRSIEMKNDPFLSRDSDVARITSVYAAMKKMRMESAPNKAEASATIEEIVQSLLASPIYSDDSGSESGESSYYSTSSENSPLKKYPEGDDAEIETGNDVFVEASSVTVCVALPVKKGKQRRDDSAEDSSLPVAVESPTKKSTQVATPIRERSSRGSKDRHGNDDGAKRKLFTARQLNFSNSVVEVLRKGVWTTIVVILLLMTVWSTPSTLSSPAVLPLDISRVVSSSSASSAFEAQDRVITVITRKILRARLVEESLTFRHSENQQSPVPRQWIRKLWHHARRLKRSRKVAVDSILQQSREIF